MTSLPLVLSLFSQSQPMDTGLVVRACLGSKSTDRVVVVRVWNASPHAVSDLRLRLHLNGAPGSLGDLGWRPLEAIKYEATGLAATGTVVVPLGTQPPTLVSAECGGDICSQVIELSLGTIALAPLEGLGMELHPSKILGTGLDWSEPSRLPQRGDWSFSNLDSASTCLATAEAGLAKRATRIELFSGMVKLWGNAPDESYERPNWPLVDFRKASFASLMRAPSDTVPVAERDRHNRTLGRWLVNQAGYRLSDVKAGRARVKGVGVASWSLIDSMGAVRGTGMANAPGSRVSGSLLTRQYDGSMVKALDSLGPSRSGDLTEIVLPAGLPAGGPYRIASATDTSAPFLVDDDLYGKLRDASLRYFGVQRSGNSASWYRPASFADDPVPGGWYDCGDRLKEGVTIGYAMEVLGALAATHSERDPDRTSWLQSLETPDGVPDLVRELRFGAEFALASWDLSGKDPAMMVTGIGDMAKDHLAWVHDTWVGLLPAARGGSASRTGRKEMGGNVAGAWAAGLAFASRLQRENDPLFAARALEAARGLYAWGKANPKVVNSATYIDAESTAELALAAVALLWATRDSSYLYDLTRNDSIAKNKTPILWQSIGGWFGKQAGSVALSKGGWFMDYADPHPLALHAFSRLILAHPDTAVQYGLEAARFDSLRDVVMSSVLRNLGDMSTGTRSIHLPEQSMYVDSTWLFPSPPLTWGFSRYFSGNLGEMLLYTELARDFQARPSTHYPAGTDFRADSIEAAAVRGMDYLLGQNPWDMSFLMGIGSRNLNHIHHRTANPEGRNLSSVDWAYRTPVGALVGGAGPNDSLLQDDWANYTNSESCLDFAASFLVPATLLSRASPSGTTGIQPRSRVVAAPRWGWNSRTGVLNWIGAPVGLRWDVLDACGRIVASGGADQGSGRQKLDLPSGISVLRWRAVGANGSLPLLHLGR